MQWKDRNLDRERDEKGQRGPKEGFGRKGTRILRQDGLQTNKIKGAGLGIQPDNPDQQQRRRQERIDEKLDSRLGATIPAEHGDNDRHGHKRQLPKGVIEEHV